MVSPFLPLLFPVVTKELIGAVIWNVVVHGFFPGLPCFGGPMMIYI
jgi:hypothetical protein